MSVYEPTDRTQLRRHAERGAFDREAVHAILDEGVLAHVGVDAGSGPVVLPMAYARIDDRLYLHGAPANAILRAAVGGAPVCVTVTILDGLVLARSAFHHSMNFRCVVAFGILERVIDPNEQLAASDALVERMQAGRSAEARRPTPTELRGTLIARLDLDEVSAKVRTGPPLDERDDLELPVWAGVVPLEMVRGTPVPDV